MSQLAEWVSANDFQHVTIDEETLEQWTNEGWSTPTIKEAVRRVNKGALLMDQQKPGWVDEILPPKLDMSMASWCIIGQTYGSYDEYVGVPFGLPQGEGSTREIEEKAAEHGFMCLRGSWVEEDDDRVTFGLLDRVWLYLLYEHKNSQVPIVLEMP